MSTKTQQNCFRNTPFQLEPNTFAREGYRFVGWSTDWRSAQAEYSDEDTATFDGDQNLYAVWSLSAEPISQVNSVLVTDARSSSKSVITRVNATPGDVEWRWISGRNYYNTSYWYRPISCCFDDESRLGQPLSSDETVTLQPWDDMVPYDDSDPHGIGGIALSSLTPRNDVLYTKVKMSPYCSTWVKHYNSAPDYSLDGQPVKKYTDVSPEVYGIPVDSAGTHAVGGWRVYSRGKYFVVKMTVRDLFGDHVLSAAAEEQSGSNFNGWRDPANTYLPPAILEFDFADQIAGHVYQGAKTVKIEFFQGTSPDAVDKPAVVNAVCLYKDTLNS